MGIFGTNKERITTLENDLASLKRTIARSSTGARPYQGRAGKWMAVLNGHLLANGSQTADLHWFDGTNTVDVGQGVTVHNFLLGPELAIPSGSKVEVEFFGDSRWYVTAGGTRPYYCTAFNGSVETATSGNITLDAFGRRSPHASGEPVGGFHFDSGNLIIENPGSYLITCRVVNGSTETSGSWSVNVNNVNMFPFNASGITGSGDDSVTGFGQTTTSDVALSCAFTQGTSGEMTVYVSLLGVDMGQLDIPS